MGKFSADIRKAKEGSLFERATLVYDKHLEWLLPYVEKLGKSKMVELGVAKGGCIALCSKVNPELEVIGCDSWEGMPEITDKDDKNKCEQWVGSKWGTKEDVYQTYKLFNAPVDKLTLLKGWFNDTLPKNINLFDNLDILRIDCDFYVAVKYCLEMLYDKVKPGGLIIFDDWHFNPKGVRGAWNDFCISKNIPFQNIKITSHTVDKGPVYFFKP